MIENQAATMMNSRATERLARANGPALHLVTTQIPSDLSKY
jgi:hypothetical protein